MHNWFRDGDLRVRVGDTVVVRLQVPYNLFLLVRCEDQRFFGRRPFAGEAPYPWNMLGVVMEDNMDLVFITIYDFHKPLCNSVGTVR